LIHTTEQSYVSVGGDGYTGAKGTLNLWRPRTESLSLKPEKLLKLVGRYARYYSLHLFMYFPLHCVFFFKILFHIWVYSISQILFSWGDY